MGCPAAGTPRTTRRAGGRTGRMSARCGSRADARRVRRSSRPRPGASRTRATTAAGLAGAAPICLSTTWPWSRRTSVGIAWTSNRRLTSGLSSALTLTSLSLPASSPASFSRAGLTIRQGPHHGAHTSTSTGRLDSSTTAWNSSSFASTTQRSGVLALPAAGHALGDRRNTVLGSAVAARDLRRLLRGRGHATARPSDGLPAAVTVISPSTTSTEIVAAVEPRRRAAAPGRSGSPPRGR